MKELSRPRMGAWIEILAPIQPLATVLRRPRMGAWIEIG